VSGLGIGGLLVQMGEYKQVVANLVERMGHVEFSIDANAKEIGTVKNTLSAYTGKTVK
jgi:hypothetical protein